MIPPDTRRKSFELNLSNLLQNKLFIVSLVIILFLSCKSTTAFALGNVPTFLDTTATDTSSTPMKGIWVASVLNIDYPKTATTNPDMLKAEAVKILDTAQAAGINAVFLQVRPTADAFYPSLYYPWSRYLTGTQGLAPQQEFDPLEFWVEQAHHRGMELHAWLNPYRITRKTIDEPAHDFASLAPSSPARLHPEWVVNHTDGNLYFDPGLPEVRQFLIDSSMELIENYAVDGIHFDDYFYPGKDFNDHSTFSQYGQGYLSIEDWRRENVNTLIRDLYRSISNGPRPVRFGISPFGIWANDNAHPMGSATRGNQTYYAHYADPLAWIQEGTIDYIAPQIYWHIGFDIADYSILLDWWHRATLNSSVDLYIGQATYRTLNTDPRSPWHGVSEIKRQLQLNDSYSGVKGSIFYNYSSLARSPELQSLLRDHFKTTEDQIAPFIPSVTEVPVTRGALSGRSIWQSVLSRSKDDYLWRILERNFPEEIKTLQ